LLLSCGGVPSWNLLYGLPALILAQLLLTYGLALVVSSVNLFFRDLGNLISVLLQMLFYLTPILYDLDKVSRERPAIVPYLKCNPVAPLMDAYRQLLLDGLFRADRFVLAILYGAAALAIGWLIHARLRWKFAEIV